MHIETAIDSLEAVARQHHYGTSYDNEADRNQVDGLVNHAFDQVMKAQTHDERGDYKTAHTSLTSGVMSARQAIDMIHKNSATADMTGHKITLEGAPRSYKYENFS
jgi:hypothetical protein